MLEFNSVDGVDGVDGVDSEIEEHMKYSGSKMPRILRCPGSVAFVTTLVERDLIPLKEATVYASEGVMLHDIMQQEIEGNSKLETADLDAEQVSCIKACMEWFNNLKETYDINRVFTEVKVTLEDFGLEETGGISDVVAYTYDVAVHIIDWKFGKGVPVNVFKNESLMLYALGAIGNIDTLYSYSSFYIHIAQPRFNYYGTYQCSRNDLLEFLNKLKAAVLMDTITPGQKQCFWCKGKPYCKEYIKYANNCVLRVIQAKEAIENNVEDFKVSLEILEYEQTFKKALKAVKDTFKALPKSRLNNLGFKRVMGKKTRSLTNTDNMFQYLSEKYNADFDDFYEKPALKSPAQLEKSIVGLKNDKKFNENYILTTYNSPAIVDINDVRSEFETYSSNAGYSNAAIAAFAAYKTS